MPIQEIIQSIEKVHGKGSIMAMGVTAPVKVDVISTGCLSFDEALGVGGLPKGRIVEVFGPESSGKTTITLEAIAEAQKAGGMAAFVDVEHALDPIYAQALGVDMSKLLISQPDNAEQALEIVRALVKTGELAIIVLDSVAALVPRAELEGEIGDAHVGLQSRLMSQAMRMLTGETAKSGTLLIFTNQLREKIGQFGHGDPTTTSGGRALKFYSSVRIDVRRIAQITEGADKEKVAGRTKINIVKNKCAVPFRVAEVDIVYGKGIDKIADVLDIAVTGGIVEKSGAWYSFNGERIGQGRSKTIDFLELNLDIFEEIKRLTIEYLHPVE